MLRVVNPDQAHFATMLDAKCAQLGKQTIRAYIRMYTSHTSTWVPPLAGT